jgi:hypothetical protein
MITQVEVTEYAKQMRQAGDRAGQSPEWWDRLRRRLATRPHDDRHLAVEFCRAYEEATGTRIGCD